MTRPEDTQDCQCCAGTDASTPARVSNPPGLSEIRYRVGRHGEFLESMKARLSSTDYPALAALGTRDGSDFTLAIADAMASMLDGLSFYTERYAQEHFLRTATERRSVVDMARLIGYRPAPGVAASTHLAFTLTSVPGVALDPITIPVGTRVQSVPGQDETAQTFETVEAVPARAEWNAIPVQQTRALKPAFGDRSLWLRGTDTGLSVGDTLLIVGAEQNKDPQAERWDVRTIQRITVDQTRQLTRVDWQVGLGHTKPFVLPAEQAVRIYTFRKRTNVFGANAPDWKVLGEEAKLGYLGIGQPSDAQAAFDAAEWPDFSALAPEYPERRSTGGSITQHAPATIEAVMAAATSAAHTTAVSAMHRAATSGIGVLSAGSQIADSALGMSRQMAEGMTEIAGLAANDVAERAMQLMQTQAQAFSGLFNSANFVLEQSVFGNAIQTVRQHVLSLPNQIESFAQQGVTDVEAVCRAVLDTLANALSVQMPASIPPDLSEAWQAGVNAVGDVVESTDEWLDQIDFTNPAEWADAFGLALDAVLNAVSPQLLAAKQTLNRVQEKIGELSPQLPSDLPGDVVTAVIDNLKDGMGELDLSELASRLASGDFGGTLTNLESWASNQFANGAAIPQEIIRLHERMAGSVSAVFNALGGQVSGFAQDAHSAVSQAAGLLNPTAALNMLGDHAQRLREHAADAGAATLSAAASAEVAALVTAAMSIARQLPGPLAIQTPEQAAAIALHFAALGVRRAGGEAPVPDLPAVAGQTISAIEAALPAEMLAPVDLLAQPLQDIVADMDQLLSAPRQATQTAYLQIAAGVEKALVGSFTTLNGPRGALVRQPDTIDITPVDDKVVTQGWALLSVPHSVELYRITQAGVASRAEYLLSGQTTRLTLSGELPDGRLPAEFEHAPRTLAVHVQSEELPLAATPVAAPVYGQTLALERRETDLSPGQPLALSGTRQRIRIVATDKDILFQPDDGDERPLAEGDSLQLMAAPVRLVPATLTLSYFAVSPSLSKQFKTRALGMSLNRFRLKTPSPTAITFYTPITLAPDTFAAFLGSTSIRLRLRVLDRDGSIGTVSLRAADIALDPARKDDELVREIVFVGEPVDSVEHDRDRTTLSLTEATTHVYVRLGTAVNANVAPATHGERVEALLGDGDGAQANQRFMLNQAPLTYVSAATPSGRASTLEVRVNDILWEEADTLYNADAKAHRFETAQDDGGVTTIRFGDGIEGARLPGGSSNVRASYRKGIGVAGNVGDGKLTTLLSRPPGVSDVVNPSPATGGEDPETLDQARDNAPLTVLTLDRAVSIVDYTNFARAFAGIDKAHALWIPSGPARGVFVTVAGIEGASVPSTSATYGSLLDALGTYGDPLMPIRLADYRDARFQTRVAVLVDAAFEQQSVLDSVTETLSTHFAFARREFGQTVSIDEVAAVAQGVSGVVAVHVVTLHSTGQPAKANARLFAQLPVATLDGLPLAAELLTPADDGIVVEVMQ
ncbi:putative baseplate assembly protein [Nitrogeniibacter aestuarii]|uniref:putative baseplate assembly protein n=1 Tax=Nitrogeniibacter aestuarii TaxID=2815343 RepID=UPI001E4317E0|nr:putative baseplate assembly protein [Nitrogeniibacter aestuarii]